MAPRSSSSSLFFSEAAVRSQLLLSGAAIVEEDDEPASPEVQEAASFFNSSNDVDSSSSPPSSLGKWMSAVGLGGGELATPARAGIERLWGLARNAASSSSSPSSAAAAASSLMSRHAALLEADNDRLRDELAAAELANCAVALSAVGLLPFMAAKAGDRAWVA